CSPKKSLMLLVCPSAVSSSSASSSPFTFLGVKRCNKS
ncbi:hypothetical protein AWRI1631_80780, partial [Saccharomyces cerevisiae AWRI1631]